MGQITAGPERPLRGRPDLRLGAPGRRGTEPTGTTPGRITVRHTVSTTIAQYTLVLVGDETYGRRALGDALRDAVAELRSVDLTYSPTRAQSLVTRLRRGEISAESWPPLAELVQRCAAVRCVTDGWFDAWAIPGGFDPSGLLGGWAAERAAGRLRAAGLSDYAVVKGGDLVVRGNAPHGGPWRVAVHHPTNERSRPVMLELTTGAVGTSGVSGRQRHVIDPHTGEPVEHLAAATVIGPDLAMADGYATALFAAGAMGLSWFPTVDGYHALLAAKR